MSLPTIDFQGIAATAKAALVAYGTTVQFQTKDGTTWRDIKAVIYNDERAQQLLNDANSMPATAILNPDDFVAPNPYPKRFDRIRVSVDGFQRTYTIESPHPILAQVTLPLILVQLTAN